MMNCKRRIFLGYNKNKPQFQTTKVPDEVKNRRYEGIIASNLEKIASQNATLEGLKNELNTIQPKLQEKYEKHKTEIEKLHNNLNAAKKDFQNNCKQREASFSAQQKRLDEQRAEIETERISISDDRKDLIENENQLINLSNTTIGRGQAADNKEEYLRTVEKTISAQKQSLLQVKLDTQRIIDENEVKIERLKDFEKDVNARIKLHDARLDEIKGELEKMKQLTKDYQKAQAECLIAQDKRDEFNREVEENRQYADRLKKTDAILQDKARQLEVKEKAIINLDRTSKERLKYVKELEARHTGGSPYGRS
jgi:chromosome segregation ATPase